MWEKTQRTPVKFFRVAGRVRTFRLTGPPPHPENHRSIERRTFPALRPHPNRRGTAMMAHSRRIVWSALAFTVIAGFIAPARVGAFSGGIASTSFSPVTGCNGCHSGGTVPTVTLTGPTSVDPDSTNEYTLTVSEQSARSTLAGLNVAARDRRARDRRRRRPPTRRRSPARAASPRSRTPARRWRRAASRRSRSCGPRRARSATVTLQAWGNAVNGNLSTSGDHAAHASLDLVQLLRCRQSSPTRDAHARRDPRRPARRSAARARSAAAPRSPSRRSRAASTRR